MLQLTIKTPKRKGIGYNTKEIDDFLSLLTEKYGCISLVYSRPNNIDVEINVRDVKEYNAWIENYSTVCD